MLEYNEANRQQLIVRQSSLDRATELLIASGFVRESSFSSMEAAKQTLNRLRYLTDECEKIVRNPGGTNIPK